MNKKIPDTAFMLLCTASTGSATSFMLMYISVTDTPMASDMYLILIMHTISIAILIGLSSYYMNKYYKNI